MYRGSVAIIAVCSAAILSCSRPAPTAAAPAGHADGASPSALADGPEWPNFRGPSNNGFSPEKGINKDWAKKAPQLCWKQSMHDGGYSGPAVAGGVVYILDHVGQEDVVRAFSIQNGEEKWHYNYADTASANYGFPRATPTVDGDRVYTMSRLGKLNCLSIADGKPVWTVDIVEQFHGKRPGWDLAGSPLIDGNQVVVLAGGPNAAVVALNKLTGTAVWAGGGSETPGYATPFITTIDGTRQYVVEYAGGICGINPKSGAILWTYSWQTPMGVNAATPVVLGNSLFVSSGYGFGCSLFEVTGGTAQKKWGNREMQAHFSSPLVNDGFIYGTGDPGQLMCIDPKTGKALWKQAGFEKGGIIGVDGVIIGFNGSNGDLIMADFSPTGYHELGRFTPLGGQSWTAPIVAEGRLIVRNKETLACFDVK